MRRAILHYRAGPMLRQMVAQPRDGWQVEVIDDRDVAAFDAALPGADAILHVLSPLDRARLERAPKLTLVQKIGVGVDTIDLDAARALGIGVANMPGTNAQAMQQLVEPGHVVGMGRPRAQGPQPERIQGYVERDEAILRHMDRYPVPDRRRRQGRQGEEEEGATPQRIFGRGPRDGRMVETDPGAEVIADDILRESGREPGNAIALLFTRQCVPAVAHEQWLFTARQQVHCTDEAVQATGKQADGSCRNREQVPGTPRQLGMFGRPLLEEDTPVIARQEAQHAPDQGVLPAPERHVADGNEHVDFTGPLVLRMCRTVDAGICRGQGSGQDHQVQRDLGWPQTHPVELLQHRRQAELQLSGSVDKIDIRQHRTRPEPVSSWQIRFAKSAVDRVMSHSSTSPASAIRVKAAS